MLQSFRSYQTALQLYRLTRPLRLPRHLRDQLDRASSSIALNLAEGYGRSSPADKRRHYQIAMGSLREVQSIIDLSGIPAGQVTQTADHLGACLYRLITRPPL